MNNHPDRNPLKRIVLVGGCFDLIHFGHIVFLTEAKKHGDELVVALESDTNVRRMKGPTRPIHTQKQRTAMLNALRMVDRVISLPEMRGDADYFKLVRDVRPAVIAVTEGDPVTAKKQQQATMIGAELVTVPKISTPSTSQLAKLLELD